MDSNQLEEIAKCASDPLYFINTYCKIVSLDDGVVSFKTYDYQDEFINLIHNNRFTIATMARQLGKSTSCGAYILWYMMFNPKKAAAIVANETKLAQEILDRVKDIYELLPDWMQAKPKVWNKRRIQLGNGSTCIAAAATKAGLRGGTINLLMIDELAWIDKNKWDLFYTSSFSTITSGKKTKIVAISTPNGLNAFYEMFTAAKDGTSGWSWLSVPWYRHPERDEAWKQTALAGMTGDKERQFAQEHELAFHGSSKTLISASTLTELVSIAPIKKSDEISIFENPIVNENYVLCVDTSEGIDSDSQAFSVLKLIKDGEYFKGEQVTTFKDSNTSPDQFAYILANYGKMYNNAWILIERASTGAEIIKTLFEEIEYENIVFTKTNNRDHMGMLPTAKTKRIGCAEFKSLIESGSLKINCEKTLNELRRFVRVNNSYAADKGYHDDLVMGLINFSYMTKQEDFQSNILDFLKKKKTISEDYLIPDIIHSDIPVIEKKIKVHSHTGSFLVGDVRELDSDELAWLMA